MKSLHQILLLLSCSLIGLATAQTDLSAQLRINEFVAINESLGELDQSGERRDWIELHNPTNQAIALRNYFLTDDIDEPEKYQLPDISLAAGGYLRVLAFGTSDRTTANFYSTGFGLSGDGEYLGLSQRTGGASMVIQEFAPEYPQQRVDNSFGINGSGNRFGFIATPTPGAVNNEPFGGIIDDTNFMPRRGVFSAPFQLTITSTEPGSTIRYTLDGSEPSETSGLIYTSPITISSTTTVRAMAFKANFISTNIDTQTYIFPAQVATQSQARPAGWPNTDPNGQVLRFGMNPGVVNNAGAAAIEQALRAIPSMSIVTPLENLVDPQTGIYVNAGSRGRAWERPASLELVTPGDEPDFQIDCGVRVRGGFSRSNANPKHAFRFFFRGSYGDSTLEFPLFGTEGVDEFNRIDLRTSQNYSWAFQNDPQNTFLREVLGRDLQRESGQPYTKSRYYHLYVNGQYWGLYMTQERAQRDYAESYLRGDENDFDVLKSQGNTMPAGTSTYDTEVTSGTFEQGTGANPGSDWARTWFAARSLQDTRNPAFYRRLQGLNPQGERDPSLPVLIDVDNLIHYMMVIGFTGNYDAPLSGFIGASNNWFGIRNRERDDRGWAFFVHDGEHSLGATSDLGTGNRWQINNNRMGLNIRGTEQRANYRKSNPGYFHLDLTQGSSEYRRRFGDLAQASLFGQGHITDESVEQLLSSRESVVSQVINAEAARWGRFNGTQGDLDRDTWVTAVEGIRRVLRTRKETFLGHLRGVGLFPNTSAPSFDRSTRRVMPGEMVSMVNDDAPQVYYTTDGSDPIGPNNEPSSTAILGDGGLTSDPFITPTGQTWRYYDEVSTNNGLDFDASDVVAGAASYNATSWKHPDFDDSSWESGEGPLAFGAIGGFQAATQLADRSRVTYYFRTTFTASNNQFVGLRLNMIRDDAAIIYLNGVEIYRDTFVDGPVILGNTLGRSDSERIPVIERLVADALQPGVNTLAVELHNVSINNSDLGLQLSLDGLRPGGGIAVPVNGVVELKARSRNATTNEWSALAQAVFTSGAAPSASNLQITEVNYNPGVLSPSESADMRNFSRRDFEFIEVTNVSSQPVDLGNASLGVQVIGSATRVNDERLEGVRATIPEGTLLQSGESLVVVADRAAFALRYPAVMASSVVAEYRGSLSDGGETVTLRDAEGAILTSFRYSDQAPWPMSADGTGSSLQTARILSAAERLDGSNYQAGAPSPGTSGLSIGGGFTGNPNRDDDGDGISALFEFLAGTSDQNAGEAFPVEARIVTVGGVDYSGAAVVVDPTVSGVSVSVEQSANLMPDSFSANGVMFVRDEAGPGQRVRKIYRSSQPITAGGPSFMRARVTLP